MRWLLSLLVVGSMLAASVRAETIEERFFNGLRERHLYRLADVHGTQRWGRDDLSDRDRAELAIQLALVYTDQALTLPPGERPALWKKAEDVCTALLDDWPDNPRRQLVAVQLALVSLSRGELEREEAVGTAGEVAGVAGALEHLRTAVRRLTDIAEAVNQQLVDRRMRPSDNLPPDAFSIGELESLSANITYQLARAQHQLGLCYLPHTPDRDDAMLQALKRLEPLAQQTTADDLVWNARIEAAVCQRELGQLQQAWQRLDAWSKGNPPADVAARFSAERIRLLLAAGKVDEAQRLIDQSPVATTTDSGDLSLAHLEALLAVWKRDQQSAGASGDGGNASELTAAVVAIGERFGPYWARRAQLLVGRTLVASGATDNADALLLTAENLFLNGRLEESLAAYDRAVELLDKANQKDKAFSAAMTAAAIARQAGQLDGAAARYRQLALRQPNHPRAAEAHRLAILSTAELLRESAAGDERLAAAYEQLLAEHLDRWPGGAAADEVRLWLGKLLASRHDWAAARDVLQRIGPSSSSFQSAVYLVVDCYERELKRLDRRNDASRQRAELIAAATEYLQPIVADLSDRPPNEWTELERWTVVALAQLHLRHADGPPTYAAELLNRVIRAVFPVSDSPQLAALDETWKRKTVSLYIVALARLGKVEEAQKLLDWQSDNSPTAVPQTLEYLGERYFTHGAAMPRETAEVVLAGLRLAARQLETLDEDSRQRLIRLQATALAAAGDRGAALAQYAALAEQFPNDGPLQESYATLLAQSAAAPELREALARWQEVERHSRRGGPRWLRARQARIELLTKLGEREEAEKLIRLTRLLYPDWELSAPE